MDETTDGPTPNVDKGERDPVRASRSAGRGSLAGRIVAGEDWDAPETNDAIARDFGLLG
ncbi:hypothetical protein [Kribbella caucasensis]|uniref:hypothetical protein n=1 Tax=Kribbella caucasensis TaxID=2512215 RepID=UPI00192D7F66|nr:hypothetical protein [Kribbella sp. VKM Ac-2527]